MIQKLHIRNCQSHKDSIIEFHSGLNVLVGDTDAGKSAIIRGLDKIIYNSMPSKELISHWGGPLLISVKIDNNLITLKNEGKDSYQLNDIEFYAIGNKVPEEIAKVFNMTDINIQNQIESFFLLTETSGYVASYLNEIANLSQIDFTTKAIKSELNETKRNIEYDKKDLEEKEKILENYSFLPKFETAIKEIEQLESKKETIEIEINIIDSALTNINIIDNKLTETKKIINLKSLVKNALNLIETINQIDKSLIGLTELLNSLQNIEVEFIKLSKISKLKPLINKIIKLKKKESDFKAKLDTLENYLYKVSTIDKELKIAMSKRESEHKLYHSELQKLDKCFFCGSKIKKNEK